jgi:hypothetical protein
MTIRRFATIAGVLLLLATLTGQSYLFPPSVSNPGGSGGGAPTGAASGVLGGTYPNPAFNSTNLAGNTMNNAFIVNNTNGNNGQVDLEIKPDPLFNNASWLQLDTVSSSGEQPFVAGIASGAGAYLEIGLNDPNNANSQTGIQLLGPHTTQPNLVLLSSDTGDFEYYNGVGSTAKLKGHSSTSLTFEGVALIHNKLSGAPGAAPGAGKCITFAVAGTNAGSCKLQAQCGTSTTAVTIADNIGAGC